MSEPLPKEWLAAIRQRTHASLMRAKDPAWPLSAAEGDCVALLVEVDRLNSELTVQAYEMGGLLDELDAREAVDG